MCCLCYILTTVVTDLNTKQYWKFLETTTLLRLKKSFYLKLNINCDYIETEACLNDVCIGFLIYTSLYCVSRIKLLQGSIS